MKFLGKNQYIRQIQFDSPAWQISKFFITTQFIEVDSTASQKNQNCFYQCIECIIISGIESPSLEITFSLSSSSFHILQSLYWPYMTTNFLRESYLGIQHHFLCLHCIMSSFLSLWDSHFTNIPAIPMDDCIISSIKWLLYVLNLLASWFMGRCVY